MKNSFSIVLPAYNAEATIARAIRSCLAQTHDDFEILVINDGSSDKTQEIVSDLMKQVRGKIRMFILPDNSGRLVARNIGMRLAQKDWICWLDADDEYMSNYLEVLDNEINDDPNFDVYNFATFIKDREVVENRRKEKGYRIRETFTPPVREDGKGHESFPSGHVGTGSFIFRRSLLPEVGYFPETQVPEGTDESLPALWVHKDPAMAEICLKNEAGSWKPLGNPWGDDYSFFWRLTRNHLSKPLDVCLYINHIRV